MSDEQLYALKAIDLRLKCNDLQIPYSVSDSPKALADKIVHFNNTGEIVPVAVPDAIIPDSTLAANGAAPAPPMTIPPPPAKGSPVNVTVSSEKAETTQSSGEGGDPDNVVKPTITDKFDVLLPKFQQAYAHVNKSDIPLMEFKSGWVTINGTKLGRFADMEKQYEELMEKAPELKQVEVVDLTAGNTEVIKVTSDVRANLAHVYFWTLPIGTEFVHKGDKWTKTSEEKAIDSDSNEWRFEIHYGCIIDKELADKIGIEHDGYRPADTKASDADTTKEQPAVHPAIRLAQKREESGRMGLTYSETDTVVQLQEKINTEKAIKGMGGTNTEVAVEEILSKVNYSLFPDHDDAPVKNQSIKSKVNGPALSDIVNAGKAPALPAVIVSNPKAIERANTHGESLLGVINTHWRAISVGELQELIGRGSAEFETEIVTIIGKDEAYMKVKSSEFDQVLRFPETGNFKCRV